MQACVAETSGKALFQKIISDTFYVEMLSGLLDKYDPRHLERSRREVKEFGGKIELIEVECERFDNLMKRYGITHIDFLSIDTEGNELDILKSIDFDQCEILAICVENNYASPLLKQYLHAKGYTLLDTTYDEIYLRNDEVIELGGKAKLTRLIRSLY